MFHAQFWSLNSMSVAKEKNFGSPLVCTQPIAAEGEPADPYIIRGLPSRPMIRDRPPGTLTPQELETWASEVQIQLGPLFLARKHDWMYCEFSSIAGKSAKKSKHDQIVCDESINVLETSLDRG